MLRRALTVYSSFNLAITYVEAFRNIWLSDSSKVQLRFGLLSHICLQGVRFKLPEGKAIGRRRSKSTMDCDIWAPCYYRLQNSTASRLSLFHRVHALKDRGRCLVRCEGALCSNCHSFGSYNAVLPTSVSWLDVNPNLSSAMASLWTSFWINVISGNLSRLGH